MYKAVAIAIAFLACALCGMQNAKRLEQHARLLRLLLDATDRISATLMRTKKPLITLIQTMENLPSATLFEHYASELNKGKTSQMAWDDTEKWMRSQADYASMQENEIAALRSFLSSLSTTDGVQLQEAIEQAHKTFELLLEQAEEQSRRKGKVYRSLGLICGAALAILLL